MDKELQILDYDFSNKKAIILENGEQALRFLKPKPIFYLSSLESQSIHTNSGNAEFRGLGSALVFGFLFMYIFFETKSYLMFTITSLMLFTYVFLIPIFNTIRRKKTNYLITNKRIAFNLCQYGISYKRSLYFADIKRVTLQDDEDGKGTVYLIPKNDPGFKTYKFANGDPTHFPVLEDIENPREVFELLKALVYKK